MNNNVLPALTQIISHRCNEAGVRQDGKSAFIAGLNSKVGAVEIDLRMTKDAKYVASHLPWFFAPDHLPRLLSTCSSNSPAIRDLLLLESVLADFKALSRGKSLWLDLKIRGHEESLLAALRLHALLEQVNIISTQYAALGVIHRLEPSATIRLSIVLSGVIPSLDVAIANYAVQQARRIGLANIPLVLVPVFKYGSAISCELIHRLSKEHEVTACAQTVDDAMRYVNAGAKSILSLQATALCNSIAGAATSS